MFSYGKTNSVEVLSLGTDVCFLPLKTAGSVQIFNSTPDYVIMAIIKIPTERGGSVVTHETRILEVPGLNPVVDQPG